MEKQLHRKLSDTLELTEVKNGGHKGFWLYDTTRRMNLAMRALDETAAFVESLHYYQNRLTQVEAQLEDITNKVNKFVEQFVEKEEETF